MKTGDTVWLRPVLCDPQEAVAAHVDLLSSNCRSIAIRLASRTRGGAGVNCPLCNHALADGTTARIVVDGRVTSETWGPAHYWCPACRLPFIKARLAMLAAAERPFKEGDHVLVQGPPGEVIGVIAHACTPYEMPHLGPGSASHEAHQLMHEWQVDFVVLIEHPHGERPLCFFALRHPGGWRDLRGNDLRLTQVRNGR